MLLKLSHANVHHKVGVVFQVPLILSDGNPESDSNVRLKITRNPSNSV